MMSLLLVEDEDSAATDFIDELQALEGPIDVKRVTNRNDALEALAEGGYDFVVCDLKIPARTASADLSVDYGMEVHAALRAQNPDIPSAFFTGFAGSVDLRAPLTLAPTEDLYGSQRLVPLVCLFYKDELRECAEWVNDIAKELAALDEIAVGPLEAADQLSAGAVRALRIFARRNMGQRVTIRNLGGLSGQVALRASVEDASGHEKALVFAKLGQRDRVLLEHARFAGNVPQLLPVGSFAPLADVVSSGAVGEAGLFFSLASSFTENFFSIVGANPEQGAAVASHARELLAPWRALGRPRHTGIDGLATTAIDWNAVRATIPPDSPARHPEIQQRSYKVLYSRQHGDLHGANLLVDGAGDILFIDFALAGEWPSCTDPVSLELSLLFHPQSPYVSAAWPSPEVIARWFDVHAYAIESPYGAAVRSLRRWSRGDAGSDEALAAVVLGFALKQMKYPDTNKTRAAAIANAAATLILERT